MATLTPGLALAQQQMVERALMGAGSFVAWPATVYLAAYVDGTEQTANGWARQPIARSSVFPNADPLVSASAIDFPQVSVATNAIDQYVIYDALTGGNILWVSQVLSPTVNVAQFGVLHIAAGNIAAGVS